MLVNKESLLKMNIQLLADGQADDENVEVGTEEETIAEETKEAKTFTQEQLDEIISKRVSRETAKLAKQQEETIKARLEAERQESEKLAKMNEADRARALAEKREQELKEREEALLTKERELEQARLLNVSKDMLAERGLSIEFSGMILATSKDANSIKKNIDIFEKNFNDAVEKSVSQRIKTGIPKTGNSTSTFNMDDLKDMTPEQINANWDKIQGLK